MGPSPFRFENMWLEVEGFKELIRDWWWSFEFRGTYSYVLMEKIKAPKVKLKAWNKGVFGNVDDQKKSAREREERMVAIEDFKKWVIMEEISWRQKSREIWLKEGDRNIGLFHKMANSCRKRNNIDRIHIGGDWLNGIEEVRTGIVNAFKVLLSDPGDWRASLEGLNFSRLNDIEAIRLEVPFT